MLQSYISFLSELENNNNRLWFDANRTRYKNLNDEFLLFVGNLIEEISKFDSAIKFLTPKDCTFRINRDIRFSKDKSPYKTNISSVFSPLAKNGSCPAYYYEIDANGQLMVGGGWYFLDSIALYKLRKIISKDAQPLLKILENPGFKGTFGGLSGDKLKTTPKGFDPEDPNIEILRYKNYIVHQNLDVTNLTDEQITAEIIKTFEVLHPLVVYLRKNS